MTPKTQPAIRPALHRLFAIAAVAAIASALLGMDGRWLHYVSKPLATALLLLLVVQTANPVSKRYQWAIAAGLVFSLCGDIFLMLPQDLFVAGLICFLITHCAYIVAIITALALLCLGWPALLLADGMGRILSAFFALFWLSRLILQLTYYDKGMRRDDRAWDVFFLGIFLTLAIIFALAACQP